MSREIRQSRTAIPSTLLAQVLRMGRQFHCSDCDARMFVRHTSGLCPHCLHGRQAIDIDELALAGVLDDPIE
jgi:hypothetical protein